MDLVVREFREDDAAGVAELLNASDRAWPGTLTGGIPYTPERVLRELGKREYHAVLVAEASGEIVGYLTLGPHWTDLSAGYVGFLDVHPDHHGKGIGKALLIAAIDRATELGLPYLGLDTWAGNERAIGLYKRVGFFWVPGTSVYMENHFPAILRLPWARELLGDSHWWDCLVREVSLEEDREEWRGRRIFRYRLEHKGKSLEVLIDQEAKAPCAVYSPGFSAELFPEEAKPVVSFPFALRFRLENRSNAAKTFSAFFRGDEGVSLSGGRLLSLEPGGCHEEVAECVLSPELRDLPRRPAPAARALVLTEAGELELACGFRKRLPVGASLYPERAVLRHGEDHLILVLENQMGMELAGELHLGAEGVSLEPDVVRFELSPGGARSFPLRVRGDAGGRALWGRFDAAGRSWEMPPLPLLSRATGDPPVGCVLEERALLVGDGFLIEARAHGGRLIIFRPGEAHPFLRQGEELGPPFAPADLGQRPWRLSLNASGGELELVARTASGRFPGLEIKKRVRLSRGPLVTLEYALANRGKTATQVTLRVSHWDLPEKPKAVAYMSPEGLVRDVPADFPVGEGDFPERLPEDWLAFEFPSSGYALGLIPQGEVEWACEWGWSWKTSPIELRPGERKVAHRYLLYIGPGDHRAVRRAWGDLVGRELAPAWPRPLVWLDHPRPLVLRGGEGELELRVKCGRGRRFSGHLRIASAHGLRLEPHETRVSAAIGDSGKAVFRWRKEGKARAGRVGFSLAGEGEERRFAAGVIFVPPEPPAVREAEREGQRVFTIEGEDEALAIAPDFGPSVISWARDGHEYLRSAFPAAKSFSWLKPWFGGIYPFLYPAELDEWNWPGKLHEEEFEAAPWEGSIGGIPLRGISLRTRLKQEKLEGLEVEVTYGAAGGGLLLTSLRVYNPSPKAFSVGAGFMGFLELGDATVETPELRRVRSRYQAWWESEGPALVRGSDGRGVLLVTPQGIPVTPWDSGEDGAHHAFGREFSLGPGGGEVIWGWWVLLSPGDDPLPWHELRHLKPGA